MKKTIHVNDKMQKNYSYVLSEPEGKNFHTEFKPELSPKELLALGIFDGKYMTDCISEFPESWFKHAKLSQIKNPEMNFFKVSASLPLSFWKKQGWIYKDDPRGWFQWYCRYYRGRRIPKEDERQIKRWKAIQRHVSQIKINCKPQDFKCRPRQRQALLHWAIDSRKI